MLYKTSTSALRYATVLSGYKVCLLGDMKALTSERDFISYEKHIVERIAGGINLGRREQSEK